MTLDELKAEISERIESKQDKLDSLKVMNMINERGLSDDEH